MDETGRDPTGECIEQLVEYNRCSSDQLSSEMVDLEIDSLGTMISSTLLSIPPTMLLTQASLHIALVGPPLLPTTMPSCLVLYSAFECESGVYYSTRRVLSGTAERRQRVQPCIQVCPMKTSLQGRTRSLLRLKAQSLSISYRVRQIPMSNPKTRSLFRREIYQLSFSNDDARRTKHRKPHQ